MSLAIFQAVPAGAIETSFDGENKPWFKRADLGRYLGIQKIKDNFKDFPSHFMCKRQDMEGAGRDSSLGRGEILMMCLST